MTAYKTFDDWMSEIEGYGLRAERVPDGAMPWIETAWRLGAEAEREACIKAINSIPWSAPTAEGERALREAAKVIASTIRSR